MTITRYEVIEVECDNCRDSDRQSIHPDYSEIDQEDSFFYDLEKKGWIYDKENDEHLCPACAKLMILDVNIDSGI